MTDTRFAGSARIVACSSPVQPGCLDDGVRRLRSRGWGITEDEDVRARARFTAGSVSQRLAGLQRWLQDPEGTHLWSARGGYGSMELVPSLRDLDLHSAPGLLLGSSDLTALQLWMIQAGARGGMYTAMPSASIARDCPDATLLRLEDLLAGHIRALATYASVQYHWRGGRQSATGPALGGCLTMVVAALAAGWLPDPSGAILFLEDVGEHPFRIQRMLETLQQAGVFAGVAGVVLGTFPGCHAPAGADYSIQDVLSDFFTHAAFPVAIGHPFGHVADGDFCDTVVWDESYHLDPAADTVDLVQD